MGTGWRKAFCTTVSRDSEKQSTSSATPNPSPRSCVRLGFFSNPSTPRSTSRQQPTSPGLRCRTAQDAANHRPSPQCNTSSSGSKSDKSRRGIVGSNPSSPRSPLKLSLFKNSFKFRVGFLTNTLFFFFFLFCNFLFWVCVDLLCFSPKTE